MPTYSAPSNLEWNEPRTATVRNRTIDTSHRRIRNKKQKTKRLRFVKCRSIVVGFRHAHGKRFEGFPYDQLWKFHIVNILDINLFIDYRLLIVLPRLLASKQRHVGMYFHQKSPKFAQIHSEGVKRMFFAKPSNSRRSPNRSPQQNCFNRFAPRNWNERDQNYNKPEIRSSPAPRIQHLSRAVRQKTEKQRPRDGPRFSPKPSCLDCPFTW